MNPKTRHQARFHALQALYQWQISQNEIAEIELDFLIRQIKKKTDIDYFKELIHSIPLHINELDEAMKSFVDRPLNEIDPIELTILRLAIYELIYRLDVPYRVVINEALELTKKFGSVEGYKFVNGILDQVARSKRVTEVKAGS